MVLCSTVESQRIRMVWSGRDLKEALLLLILLLLQTQNSVCFLLYLFFSIKILQ